MHTAMHSASLYGLCIYYPVCTMWTVVVDWSRIKVEVQAFNMHSEKHIAEGKPVN